MLKVKEKLDKYSKEGLVNANKSGDLTIYNYTPEVQFEKKWDEYTLMARGLILHDDGTIIARPWPKFFNLGEQESTFINNLPSGKFEVSEKLDGSLGILYYYNGWKISTRGSFDSDQAKHAQNILDTKYKDVDFSAFKDYTLLFEIVYSQNRIVVDYGNVDDIFLIGAVNKETGKDLNYYDIMQIADKLGLKTMKLFEKSIDEIIEESKNIKENKEGYVLRFENGLRVKCKTDEYCRLHKILTGFSVKNIWEMLMNRDDQNKVLVNVPDEFHKWFEEEKQKLCISYESIENKAKDIFIDRPDFKNRKDCALYFQSNGGKLISILFAMLDDKDYRSIIWKMIRPKTEDVILKTFNKS